MEYGKNENDIYFEAKFIVAAKTEAYAVYDSNANFKAYKEQISRIKLPKNIQIFLESNYTTKPNTKTKLKSKTKPKTTTSVSEVYSVVDAKNKTTYEVKAKKDGENYSLIFDSEGNLIKTIEIA